MSYNTHPDLWAELSLPHYKFAEGTRGLRLLTEEEYRGANERLRAISINSLPPRDKLLARLVHYWDDELRKYVLVRLYVRSYGVVAFAEPEVISVGPWTQWEIAQHTAQMTDHCVNAFIKHRFYHIRVQPESANTGEYVTRMKSHPPKF